DGTLDVELLDGFLPSPGDHFRVLTFGSRRGGFVGYTGLELPASLALEPIYDEHSLTLLAVAVPEPGAWLLATIGGLLLAASLRRCP
ncbi:MAG: hypothetical protein ACC645_12835, partial [Pirellulales bacterium]